MATPLGMKKKRHVAQQKVRHLRDLRLFDKAGAQQNEQQRHAEHIARHGQPGRRPQQLARKADRKQDAALVQDFHDALRIKPAIYFDIIAYFPHFAADKKSRPGPIMQAPGFP